MRAFILTAALLASAGCITPRSLTLGQTATTLGTGNGEIALAMGGSYQRLTQSTGGTTDVTTVTNLFTVPEIEANAAFGLSDTIDLNIHMSTAGIQPGVKIQLSKGEWNLAVLPEFAFVYTGSNATNGASRSIMIGAKGIASHTSGLYGGLGYDLRAFDRGSVPTAGGGGSTLSHYGALALGYELKMGGVRLRPELAFAFAPVFSLEENATGMGTELIVLPNITIAVGGSTKSKP